MKNRTAFTLIEMTVTLTILALAASLVVVRYREPLNAARTENAFEQISKLDRRVRYWTQTNHQPANIKVDLDRGTFTAETLHRTSLSLPEVKIPDGMKLNELRILNENRFGKDTVIPYTSQGIAPCWSCSIVYSGGRERFQMMLGLTGQCILSDSGDALKQIEKIYEQE